MLRVSTLVVFRGWWVRERISYSKQITNWGPSERTRQRAVDTMRWYEMDREEAERRFAYCGVGVLLLGIVILLVKASSISTTARAPNPRLQRTALRAAADPGR